MRGVIGPRCMTGELMENQLANQHAPGNADRYFAHIGELEFDLDADTGPGQLEKLLQLTERYCVVFQTLRHSPAMTSGIRRIAD